jgi:hypothetical protein
MHGARLVFHSFRPQISINRQRPGGRMPRSGRQPERQPLDIRRGLGSQNRQQWQPRANSVGASDW